MIISKLDKYIKNKNKRKYKKLEVNDFENVFSSNFLENTIVTKINLFIE